MCLKAAESLEAGQPVPFDREELTRRRRRALTARPIARVVRRVTRYQWLVLVIASAGWVFDAFEGQLFNITRGHMLRRPARAGTTRRSVQRAGATGSSRCSCSAARSAASLFGTLADRFGRKPTMALTILFYSVFSGLTYFATELWHVAVLRFLVALGVGGEWAVAAALVAEVFPPRARVHALAASSTRTSVLGTWLAALRGPGGRGRVALRVPDRRVPALLVLWVRGRHQGAGAVASRPRRSSRSERRRGSFRELFGVPRWARPAILGLLLAAVGLGTFWGVTVAGQDLTQELLLRNGVPPRGRRPSAPSSPTGSCRRPAAASACSASARWPSGSAGAARSRSCTCWPSRSCRSPATCRRRTRRCCCMLPLFGFFTVGDPRGLRGLLPRAVPRPPARHGDGVCFNGGRLLAAPILWLSGMLKGLPGMDLRLAVTMLSSLFLVGLVC